MKLSAKIRKLFGKKRQIVEISEPMIIMEETTSIANKVNKQRINPGLKFESVDFFHSKKILYPANTNPETVEKMREEARDICWQELHKLELDYAHGHQIYTHETPWDMIQEARAKENAEAAVREAELEADRLAREADRVAMEEEVMRDQEAQAKLGIEEEPILDDCLTEQDKDEILSETFPEKEPKEIKEPIKKAIRRESKRFIEETTEGDNGDKL